MALEPRLVFDGAGAATAHAAGRDHADGADADGSDAGGAADAHDTTPSPDTPAAAGSPAASGSAPSIALIDTRVAGYTAIAASLPADTHIVYVDGSRDGLAALDAAIRDAGAPVASVSIYAHGSEASITLGKRTLDAATLSGEAAGVLAAWREALSPDADLLIYGCSVAASHEGAGFVHRLADLTGADVAASDDATGSAAAGGDWALEVASGAIEHASGAVDGFSGLLLPTSITDSTPGTRTVAEDGTLTVTGLTLADGDDPASMTLRVQTTGGSSTFALTGLTVTAGSNGSADVTLSGSRANLAAALASFTFSPAANQNSGISGYAPHIDFTATDVSNHDTSASFTLNGLDVTAANDAPTLAVTPVTVAEDASSSFTAGNFNLVDVDNLPAQVIYKITALPAHGTLSLAGNPLVIGSSFDSTQAGNLVYTHDGTQVRASLYAGSEADSFTIRVDDGAQGVIAAVTVPVVLTPVNQAPGISAGATVWEGQQNVPVTLTISDPDQASGLAHTIRIDTLPLRGTLYYDGVAVTAGQSIADPTKLSYSHDGNDLNGGFPPNETFQISVTDDGGGQGAGYEQSVTQTVTLTINRVNDDPRLLTNDPLTVNGASNPIGNTLLAVSDPDSFAQNLTFTLTDTSGLAHGELQLNGVRLDAGASFTQLDIDNGALQYVWTSGTQADTFTDHFDFTVRDGAITRLPNDFTQTREGGISPNASDPNAALSVFTFTINKQPLSSGSPGSGSGSGSGPNQPPAADTLGSIGYARLSEGGTVTITHADLNFTDADNAPAEIVYRLLDLPTGGTLQLAGTALGLYDTFTQADIDAGRLQFVHAGGEVFTTDFDFNVTDGTNLNDNGGLDFNFRIQVRPIDDAPVGNAPAGFLMEDGYLVFNSNAPGPQLSASARIDLTLGDVDGSGDQVWVNGAQNPGSDAGWDPSGYSLADTSSQLYLKLDSLPVNGVLQRHDGSSWITITAADLATLKITQAELDAGRLRYRHDGNDGAGDLADSFTYTAYDRFDTAGSLQTVTLAMAPLNDPPVASINAELTVHEGGLGTIGGTNGGGTGGAKLAYSDSDNTTVQRQYRISLDPDTSVYGIQHGTLMLNGVALGAGSVFTQDDLDNGRVTYRHNGSETSGTHLDHFSFTVSDGGGDNPVTLATNNVPGIYYINVDPANDKPTVTATQTTLEVTVSGDAYVSVPRLSTDDPDLVTSGNGATDFLRAEIRVYDNSNNPVTTIRLDFTYSPTGTDPAPDFVSGRGTDSLIVQGTQAAIDQVLASLQVAYTADRNVDTDKLRITIDDRLYDNSGLLTTGANGGLVNQDDTPVDAANNRVSADIRLTASNLNNPPAIGNNTAYTINEDTSLTLSGFTISDADSFTKDVSVTVRLYADAAYTTLADAATQGALTIPSATGLTAASGNGTNTVTLTGPLTNVLAALNALRFQGATDFNNGPLYLRTSFTDWGHADVPAGNQSVVDNTIILVPVNDAPVLTVPGTQTLNTGNSVAIHGIGFQDTKDTAQGASDDDYAVTVQAPETGDQLAVTSSGSLIAITGNATQTLVIRGNRAAVNATLDSLIYSPAAANLDKNTTYTLTVSVDDNSSGAGNGTEGSGVDGNNTVTATIDVRVSNINEGPVLNRPVDQTFVEDSKSNAIPAFSFTDADDFGLTMQVTITALHGDIDFDSHSDLTNTGGTYNSPSVTVQGTKAALNTALSHLRYSPTGNYHGSDTLTVTVNDLGNVGSNGTPLTATQSITITVTPVNDRPVATSDVTLPAIGEDISAPTGTPIDSLAFGYSDAVDDQHLISGNAADTTATLFTYVAVTGNAATAAQGIWQVSTTDSPDAGNPADWITIPITGLDTAHALVFTVDRQVRFVPAANFFGTPGALTVRLADGSANLDTSLSANAAQTRDLTTAGGLDDTGAWNAESRSIGISINGINDQPTLSVSNLSVAEDTADPAGTTVASLFGGHYSDATDDRSGINGGVNASTLFGGLAIVGNAADATTQGVWQYNDNAGSGWVTIGSGASAPSDTGAIVLPTTAQLRFLPNVANYNGTPGSLTVRGADSPQTAATGVDLSAALALGQISTWSTTTTLTATVTPVNDAPTMSQTAIDVSVTENATTASGQSIDPVALMTAGSVGDIDLTTTAVLGSSTFGTGSLSVTISDGVAGDEIVFASGYSLPAGVTFTGGTGNTPLVVRFDADTTLAEVDGLIAAIRYRSTSDNPTQYGTDNTRQYTVVLDDGNNAQAGGNAGGPAALDSPIRIGQIAITAANDPPIAVDDSNAISENTASVSGNVRPGTAGQDSDPDTPNAELTVTAIRTGAKAGSGTVGTVGSALAGQYGTLTLNADGTYTYALDNSHPAVNALLTSQTLTEHFTYTLADPLGGSDQAQLTITISGATDSPPSITPVDGNGAATGEATVFEAGLSATADTRETATGTITVTAGEKLQSVTIGGTTLDVAQLPALVTTPITIDTGKGTLVLTGFTATTTADGIPTLGTLDYRYTLKTALDQPGATESVDPVALEVRDRNGASSTGTLSVRIVDDVPTANADSNAVRKNLMLQTSGNVFSNGSSGDVADRIGADGPATSATPVTAVSFAGAAGTLGLPLAGSYGALTLNADGSYRYVLDNSLPAVQALGSSQSLTETFRYTLTDQDGDTASATLTVTINGYTPAPPAITPVDGNGAATGQATVFEAGLTDVADDSETTTGTITVSAPEGLVSLAIGNQPLSAARLATLDGSPLTIDTGAGLLTLTAYVPGAGGDTLHYTYTLKTARLQPGADESTDVIGLAVSDAAGGSANGTLIVRIVDDTPLARPDFASVGSTDLLPASGNVHANGGAGDQADRIGADVTPSPVTAISGPGGGSFSVPAGTNSTTGTVVTGQYGSLTIGADGSYAYRPDPDNLTVTLLLSGQSLTETFRYTITDADGDQAVSTLTITILGTSQPSTQPPPPPGDPAPPGTTPPGTTPPETISPVTTPPDGSPPGVTPPGSGPTPDSGHPLVDSPRPSLAGTGGDTPTGTGGGTPTAIDPLALTLTSFLQTRLGLALAELEPAHDTNPFPRLFSDNGLTLFPRLGDGHDFELYLYGEARDQLMTELRPDTFTVPKDLFRHTNPLEHLSFEAMQPDGRALPEWLKFDRESLRFNGTPPKGFGGLDVVIIATDSQGRHAAAQFRIRPAKEVEPGPETAPAQSPAPELIPDADTPPQAARSLPAADWLAALGLHDDAAAHPAPALAPDAGHDGFSARLQQALPPTLAEQSRALADVLLAAD